MNEKISIICPSFNHEKYISFFINSVLNQTYQNFELIINDDCSKDNTLVIAKSYDDSRIIIQENKINSGINHSINQAFARCSGNIVVFCASDDMLEINYLQNIINIFSKNDDIGVIYSNLQVIDENNNHLHRMNLRYCNNVSSKEIIADIFNKGNVLYSPGMAVRFNIIKSIFPLDMSMVNHQDTAMHLKILSITEPYIETKHFVLYRIEQNHSCSLSNSDISFLRAELETFKLLDLYLDIGNMSIIKYILHHNGIEIKNYKLMRFYLGLAALKSENLFHKYWGYRQIMNYISENGFDELYDLHEFNFASYLKLLEQYIDAKAISQECLKLLKKAKKYKKITKIIAMILLVSLILNMYFFI